MLRKLYIIIFLLCTYTSVNCHTSENGIAIIVNNENPVSQLTTSEVKLYWLRKIKKRWPELNKNIKPVDRRNECMERNIFYSRVLNMNSSEVENYFTQRQYSNAEKPQDKMNSDDDVIAFVKEEPGAIGYISKNRLTDKLRDEIKIILVID